MRAAHAVGLVVALAAIAGCSRQETNQCEPDRRYATASSAPPVQIPDDLSPPNESDALRLPAGTAVGPLTQAGECLEAPPSFFGEARPFPRGDQPSDREQPAERPEPAAPGGDRVIEN